MNNSREPRKPEGIIHYIKSLLSTFNFRSPLECEYKTICDAYRANSDTCTKEIDRNYCGAWRGFK
jgi:hypothetical protein